LGEEGERNVCFCGVPFIEILHFDRPLSSKVKTCR
jgi:hypothetical protein